MKRLLIAAAILAGATMQAAAQAGPGSALNNAGKIGSHADAAAKGADGGPKVKANDRAYNAALHNLPDKQYDPWRGVR
jgi:Skp family chaperone for outer membrane proteins